MAKTKEGAYFLDFNPLHFKEILDYLRTGRIVLFEKDSNLLEGVKNLADYFGLTELIKELGSIEKELICLFFFIYSSLLNFRF